MKKTIHANGITMAYQMDGPETAPIVFRSKLLRPIRMSIHLRMRL